MTDNLTEQVIREIDICIFENKDISISPASVAACVLEVINSEGITPPLVEWMANLEIRQLARGKLRKKYEIEEDDNVQHDIFEGLQQRYPVPVSKGEENKYILLEHLTHDELMFNVNRLRKEAEGKLKHADLLEAYTNTINHTAVS